MRKKLLDRDVTWGEIPDSDKPLYEKAREAEWGSWMKFKCVRVCTEKGSDDVRRRGRAGGQILGADFKYKDKNSAMRTEENQLPAKAKARLCVQGQMEAGALSGRVKLDAPAVQR
eukprot:14815089-Alexandrium_andersonii.AAC.1